MISTELSQPELVHRMIAPDSVVDTDQLKAAKMAWAISPDSRVVAVEFAQGVTRSDLESALANTNFVGCFERELLALIIPQTGNEDFKKVLTGMLNDPRFFSPNPIRAGISSPVDMAFARAYRRGWKQAVAALEIARVQSRADQLTTISDLGVFEPLLDLECSRLTRFTQMELSRFMNISGYKLPFDQIIDTIFAALEHSNLDEASQNLYIHTNTLKYRLKMISKGVGLDLNNPNTRASLNTVITLYRVLPRLEQLGF